MTPSAASPSQPPPPPPSSSASSSTSPSPSPSSGGSAQQAAQQARVKACVNCKLAKTACSAGRPCMRCERLQLHCVDREWKKRGRKPKFAQVLAPVQAVPARSRASPLHRSGSGSGNGSGSSVGIASSSGSSSSGSRVRLSGAASSSSLLAHAGAVAASASSAAAALPPSSFARGARVGVMNAALASGMSGMSGDLQSLYLSGVASVASSASQPLGSSSRTLALLESLGSASQPQSQDNFRLPPLRNILPSSLEHLQLLAVNEGNRAAAWIRRLHASLLSGASVHSGSERALFDFALSLSDRSTVFAADLRNTLLGKLDLSLGGSGSAHGFPSLSLWLVALPDDVQPLDCLPSQAFADFLGFSRGEIQRAAGLFPLPFLLSLFDSPMWQALLHRITRPVVEPQWSFHATVRPGDGASTLCRVLCNLHAVATKCVYAEFVFGRAEEPGPGVGGAGGSGSSGGGMERSRSVAGGAFGP